MRTGFSLLEVLIALAVLALTLASVAALQATALRAQRGSTVHRELAARVANELRWQRLAGGAACGAQGELPAGWRCTASRSCLAATVPCAVSVVRVHVEAAGGVGLTGVTAVSAEFERLPVAEP